MALMVPEILRVSRDLRPEALFLPVWMQLYITCISGGLLKLGEMWPSGGSAWHLLPLSSPVRDLAP